MFLLHPKFLTARCPNKCLINKSVNALSALFLLVGLGGPKIYENTQKTLFGLKYKKKSGLKGLTELMFYIGVHEIASIETSLEDVFLLLLRKACSDRLARLQFASHDGKV